MRNAILIGLALAALTTAAAADERELKGTTDAKDLKSLRLDAHVGTVEVQGTDRTDVAWTLRLKPKNEHSWFGSSKDSQRAVDGATVHAVAAGDAWELSVTLPRGSDTDEVQEHWLVEVPKRFAVELDANVGEASVRDAAGGVDAKLNVGDLRLDVPQGVITARVNVGDVRIVTHTKALGAVRLEANVGDANLRVGGKRVDSDRQMLIGAEVSVSNPGKDDITARANVGDVEVRVE